MNDARVRGSRPHREQCLPPISRRFRRTALSRTIAGVPPDRAMIAYVYKSLKKADTYLYLAKRDDFGGLPEPLRTQLGALQFVLEVNLVPERKLARENPEVVRANLAARGFHLQFPPTVEDPMTSDWGTDA
jgi:uncharacterized protein YcgL (UPF0745 family)